MKSRPVLRARRGARRRNAPRTARADASLRRELALAATVAAGIMVVGAIIARLGVDEEWAIDHEVRARLQAKRMPRTRAMLDVAGHAGAVAVYAPAALVAAAVVARRGTPVRALPILGAVGGAAVLSYGLKLSVERPRPPARNAKVSAHPSFPSGHATRASATALAIAYVLAREGVLPPRVAFPLAGAVATLAGVSRASADAHWTTDVIGGWAAGAATAAAAAWWYERVR